MCIVIFSFSLISLIDAKNNIGKLTKGSYFNSESFQNTLYNNTDQVMKFYLNYKDYSTKSEEDKITKEAIEASKSYYEDSLNNRINDIEEKYKYQIQAAKNSKNEKEEKILIDEQNKKIEEAKKQYKKSDEEIKKEILENKDKEYKNAKDSVDKIKDIIFYIINIKTNEIYTNLEDTNDIEDYIKRNAFYSVRFPNLKQTDGYFKPINDQFYQNGLRGYFVVPNEVEGYNLIKEEYENFNSGKYICIKQGALGISELILGIIILIYVMKNKGDEFQFIEKIFNLYEKIPLDLRIGIFIIYTAIVSNKMQYYDANYIFVNISNIVTIGLYIFYLMINIKEILNLVNRKGELQSQWEKSVTYKFYSNFKESLLFKSVLFKIIIILMATALWGIFLQRQILYFSNRDSAIMSIFFIVIYLITVGYYILKKVAYFNKIIKSTDKIIDGDLNFDIEEKGKNQLSRLAHNINNIKKGYKKSVKNEVKSERLKSELITNVSHDLKTPLTSIINYIDLLKEEGLSKEEIDGYIAVLDRKSKRLKVLIEDLFEATKISSGAVELNIEKLNVVSLLKQALAEFDEKIEKSSLIFKVKIDDQKIYANLDGKKTWRVFDNLINNIVKYSQPNTRVYIELKEENDKVVVTMKNISAYEMDFDPKEIYERFKRGDKSRNTEGTGLGLAIANSIVEIQGGSMDIAIDGDLFKVTVKFNIEK